MKTSHKITATISILFMNNIIFTQEIERHIPLKPCELLEKVNEFRGELTNTVQLMLWQATLIDRHTDHKTAEILIRFNGKEILYSIVDGPQNVVSLDDIRRENGNISNKLMTVSCDCLEKIGASILCSPEFAKQ